MSSTREKEIQERKKFVENAPVDDYLTEDPPVNNQNYFVLSYLLPDANNELKFPTIKMRGAYRTEEDCSKRIKQLKGMDKYFNMYVCEVGKFGSLLPNEELSKMDDIDIQYRESMLNTMVQEYKHNKDLADRTFQKRKEQMTEKARYEGSKKGQEELGSKKENPVSVKTRVETTRKHIKDLELEMHEASEILRISEEKYKNEYTKEEIEQAEQEYKKQYKEKFTVDDFQGGGKLPEF